MKALQRVVSLKRTYWFEKLLLTLQTLIEGVTV
jgi:hypothetical protein